MHQATRDGDLRWAPSFQCSPNEVQDRLQDFWPAAKSHGYHVLRPRRRVRPCEHPRFARSLIRVLARHVGQAGCIFFMRRIRRQHAFVGFIIVGQRCAWRDPDHPAHVFMADAHGCFRGRSLLWDPLNRARPPKVQVPQRAICQPALQRPLFRRYLPGRPTNVRIMSMSSGYCLFLKSNLSGLTTRPCPA